MSKLAAAVSALVEQLESHESQLEALTAKVQALEARLVKATTAAEGADLVLIRDEPTIALAEYRRQLDDVVFEPEGDGVTPAMRAEHRAAVDAAERAASWIEKISKTRDKEIYAAIGAGRKALIRLAAMREHRPVPLSLLTDDELSGYLNAATDVHTEDRFRWEGTREAEFLLDRPEFGRPVFVEVVPTRNLQSTMYVVKVQRTDRNLKDVDRALLYEPGMVYRRMVAPNITHMRVTGTTPWRARVLPFDEMPSMDAETTGRGDAFFRHTLGAKTVTLQGTAGGSIYFVPDCQCADTCDVYEHWNFRTVGDYNGDFREDVTLPAGTGMLYLELKPESLWSVTVLDDETD